MFFSLYHYIHFIYFALYLKTNNLVLSNMQTIVESVELLLPYKQFDVFVFFLYRSSVVLVAA